MFVRIFLVLLIGLLVKVRGHRVNKTPEPVDLFLEACLNESGANASDVESLKEGNYYNPTPELKKWVFCYLMKTGVMSSVGVLRQHVVLRNIPEKDQNDVETTINKCLYNKAHNPVETAWHYVSCFHSNNPQFAKEANRI